jgi:hypothetical protein
VSMLQARPKEIHRDSLRCACSVRVEDRRSYSLKTIVTNMNIAADMEPRTWSRGHGLFPGPKTPRSIFFARPQARPKVIHQDSLRSTCSVRVEDRRSCSLNTLIPNVKEGGKKKMSAFGMLCIGTVGSQDHDSRGPLS